MKSENFDKWTFSTQNRQTVSPLRLSLSATTSAPESPKVQPEEPKPEYDSKFDLTDRYSLMLIHECSQPTKHYLGILFDR